MASRRIGGNCPGTGSQRQRGFPRREHVALFFRLLWEVLVFWCLMMACRILAALLSSKAVAGVLPKGEKHRGRLV